MTVVQKRENIKKQRKRKKQKCLKLDKFIVEIYMNYFYLKTDT